MAIIEVEVTDFFVMAEILGTNQHIISVTDVLDFRQSGDEIDLHASVNQRLIYTEHLRYSMSVHRTIVDTLVFHQEAWRNQVGNVYQNLTFYQQGEQGQFASQTLEFTETVVGTNSNGVFDTLDFTETVVTSTIYNRSVTDTLVMNSTCVGFLPKPEFINGPVTVPDTPTPNPTITVSVPAVQNVNPTIYLSTTALEYNATITLTSPKGRSITLSAPDLGNSDEIGQTRIQRQSRGGDFIIWRAGFWPTSEEFNLTFSFLNDQTVSELQDILNEAVGGLYTYLDHEGNSWSVIITTPELQVDTTNYPKATFKLMVVKEADA